MTLAPSALQPTGLTTLSSMLTFCNGGNGEFLLSLSTVHLINTWLPAAWCSSQYHPHHSTKILPFLLLPYPPSGWEETLECLQGLHCCGVQEGQTLLVLAHIKTSVPVWCLMSDPWPHPPVLIPYTLSIPLHTSTLSISLWCNTSVVQLASAGPSEILLKPFVNGWGNEVEGVLILLHKKILLHFGRASFPLQRLSRPSFRHQIRGYKQYHPCTKQHAAEQFIIKLIRNSSIFFSSSFHLPSLSTSLRWKCS